VIFGLIKGVELLMVNGQLVQRLFEGEGVKNDEKNSYTV